MKKLINRTLLLTILLIFGSAAFFPNAWAKSESSKPIKIRFAMIPPANHPTAKIARKWFDMIEKKTDNKIKFTIFGGGTLLTPAKSWDELQKGTADGAQCVVGLGKEGFPIVRNLGAFFYGASFADAIKVMKALYEKFPEIQAEYGAAKPFSFMTGTGDVYVMTTKKAIRSVDDFKGLTLKPPTQYMDLPKVLGGASALMPMTEQYGALEKNIIDGFIYSPVQLKAMKFAEVTKYCTNMHMGMPPVYPWAFNWDTWNKLPTDVQKIIEDNGDALGMEIMEFTMNADADALNYAKKMGNEIIDLPAEEINKLNDTLEANALKVAADLDGQGLPGTKILQETRRLIEQNQN